MCILNEEGVIEEQKFGTLTSDLLALGSELEFYDVFQVTMGKYQYLPDSFLINKYSVISVSVITYRILVFR